ncbi:TIGR02452 family protein [Vagococcus acidifermentans]|uniref:TIGR02452 family protein n=1 Tax=Vagococcus acidifermentans TaxID=564710 RepID=A0A430ALK2_9ENTE|nr:TIGR02452 family protein [Vagococcus acidifermentans]RSU09001.1 TIGR02452 family protein [Vagococcus acidifermentans]
MGHRTRKDIAAETLTILENGEYTVQGKTISLKQQLARSLDNSRFIPAEEQLTSRNNDFQTRYTFANESTVDAIFRLAHNHTENIGVLNFASAVDPGGNFFTGAVAQEEALAIASNLYQTQLAHQAYYQINRRNPSLIYTDNAIYSPDTVFFREDTLALTDQPVTASVLTIPAVNLRQAAAVGEDTSAAEHIMARRMGRILAIFHHTGDDTLILGAFGCGVFGNDPQTIADIWYKLLTGDFKQQFRHVHFAVLDHSISGKSAGIFKTLTNALSANS